MPFDVPPAVLHITAANGGGSDRYIRDLAATTSRRHFALHVGGVVDVLEDIDASRFLMLDAQGDDRYAAQLARWQEAARVGIAHLHSLSEACRTRLASFREAAGLPYVVTLHDLLFMNPRAFESTGVPAPDIEWIGRVSPTLRSAAAVIAPSAFLHDVAGTVIPRIPTTVIEPGLRARAPGPVPPVPTDFAALRPHSVVAIVGAIGPHKGSGVIDGLVAALEETDIGIVVIGYTNNRLAPGWIVPGRLYVHGAYQEEALAGWLAAYAAALALFPNRLPESFSYTLSEVWAAGIPVIVPDDGALGARVASHGGGFRLPSGFTGADAAAKIMQLMSSEGVSEMARVKSALAPRDPRRVPPIEIMSRELDALYAHFAVSRDSPVDTAAAQEALAPLLAANLNSFLFRKELMNLASQLAQAQGDLDVARARCSDLERAGAAWAAKLEGDIATLRQELLSERDRLNAEVGRLAAVKAQVDDRVGALTAEMARLEEERRVQNERADALAAQIDAVRTENRRLAEESAQLAADVQQANERNRALDADVRQRQDTIARLEQDTRTLEAAKSRTEEAKASTEDALRASEEREREGTALNARLEQEMAAREHEMAAREREMAAREHELGAEIERIDEANRILTEHKAAFDLLPTWVRDYLHKRRRRARG